MADPFLGEIRMFGGNFAPLGWALCDGQLLPISANAPLFSIIGTFYGGNGTSTFQLPNLQGLVPMHQGQGPSLTPRVIGETGGSPNVTLNLNELAAHNHPMQARAVDARVGTPDTTTALAKPTPATNPAYQTSLGSPIQQLNAASVSSAGGTQGGGAAPHNNMQPYLVVNFIIALRGVFPTRN
jgi:microcystin-dependent protein